MSSRLLNVDGALLLWRQESNLNAGTEKRTRLLTNVFTYVTCDQYVSLFTYEPDWI